MGNVPGRVSRPQCVGTRSTGEAEERGVSHDVGIPAPTQGSAGLLRQPQLLPPAHCGLRGLRDHTVLADRGQLEELATKPEDRGHEEWEHAVRAFEVLKSKLATAPILKHFDSGREVVVTVYANDWASSGVLAQVHDDVCMPVNDPGRAAGLERLLRDVGRKVDPCLDASHDTSLAVPIQGTARSALAGEEELLGALAASITPRAFVDAALEETTPQRRASRFAVIPIPTIALDDYPRVLIFGAFGAAVWKLRGWKIARAVSGYATGITVNEAEYRGLLLGCSLLEGLDIARLIVCGDSNLIVRQMRDEMECKSPGLKRLRQRARNAFQAWPRHEHFHVRRDWNASGDLLAGQALQQHAGRNTYTTDDLNDLRTLNRLAELIRPRSLDPYTVRNVYEEA
ncbi:hypothetical protein ON010_g14688 [Phytophthora cinnamomi]|nr:hypothetical protein ON010_g14688 [Phytophthora cinnamomi]